MRGNIYINLNMVANDKLAKTDRMLVAPYFLTIFLYVIDIHTRNFTQDRCRRVEVTVQPSSKNAAKFRFWREEPLVRSYSNFCHFLQTVK